MIILNLKQVKELIQMFADDEETEVGIDRFDAQEYVDDDGSIQIAPAGVYAFWYEYLEEGCIYLGEDL